MTKKIICLACETKPAKNLPGFTSFGKIFCSLHCAATFGFGKAIPIFLERTLGTTVETKN